MRLSDLPLTELKRILADTEKLVGPDAVSVRILRRAVEQKGQVERVRKAVRRAK